MRRRTPKTDPARIMAGPSDEEVNMREPTRDGNDPSEIHAGTSDSLGTPVRMFKPSPFKRIAMAVCGAAMLGCGLFVTFYPGVGGTEIIFGPYLAGAGGLVLIAALYFLRSQTLLICARGIQRSAGRKQEHYLWHDVCEIASVQVKRGLVTSRRCLIVGKDGTQILLTDIAIGEYDDMLAVLRQLAAEHAIPWKEEQLVK
ncbi:MAG TPA: hypothetical protein VFE62_00975 [Gemmataceae bacterium]|nr:hypothetical protein [Gemmataceae bacterium]